MEIESGCKNVQCRHVKLLDPVEAWDTTIRVLVDEDVVLQDRDRLGSPVQVHNRWRATEWMRVSEAKLTPEGYLVTVARGADFTLALSWPKDTVFHKIPPMSDWP